MTGRLRSDVLVGAIVRTTQSKFAFAYVRHRGHDAGGVIHLIIEEDGGYAHYAETQTADGALAWRCQKRQADIRDIDARLEKEKSFDRDLWIIELEGGVTLSDLPGVLLDDGR
ncbi:DUF1491 family protein [Parvularcula sp. LCG005]|uniref:DUF1491 family protein n=1 Tax=Parvularcula sp. LCG005 TaxID=3078805 RepID=UPI0029439300|nr:DUF1491 family protein [Parvularcula sp. LCG005]WOI53984.1 DUF1491 family protein [Parvularcula sp. LCG005]